MIFYLKAIGMKILSNYQLTKMMIEARKNIAELKFIAYCDECGETEDNFIYDFQNSLWICKTCQTKYNLEEMRVRRDKATQDWIRMDVPG